MADSEFPTVESFGDSPAGLREAYDKARSRVRELQSELEKRDGELRVVRFERAGFPEGSEAFSLLSDFYQGNADDLDAIKEFAAKYGHQPGTPAGGDEGADFVGQGDQRLDGLRQSGQSNTPTSAMSQEQQLVKRINELESSGDRSNMSELISLKNQLHLLRR